MGQGNPSLQSYFTKNLDPNSWVLSSQRACDLGGGINPERWVLDDLSPSVEGPGTRYSDIEVGEQRFRCQALGGWGLFFP